MAPERNMALVLFLAFFVFLQGAFGGLICEELPMEQCSYAVSESGYRCLLETEETTKFQCKTSGVIANNDIHDHIETDECIKACGLDRNIVGISSDGLIDSRSLSNICSFDCSLNCPNIVDLYNDLAMAEGADLTEMCKALQNSPRRMMMVSKVVRSSGIASGPVSAAFASAPYAAAAAFDEVLSPTASIEYDQSFSDGAWAPAPL
ncbi:OLC1v1006136C1 [Oldenlandia corymbosa var. corymbosa]|uniref:OLC1v1006136C1 n=1 Tax=Oldenlandia corymbosa var. corymbosa TaxID=529605 RepID=A0AAV1DJ97_OLDCO|nr:OLC1v1006136C1 [Oldenlandia corymbosa var. corymbosa]